MIRFWSLFLRGVSGHKMMSIASVCIISAAMVLIGVFTTVGLNVSLLTDKLSDNREIIAYLSDDIALPIEVIEEEISVIDGVDDVVYFSAEDRLAAAAEQMTADDAEIFTSGVNILRDSFIIKLSDIENAEAITKKINAVSGIEEVVCNSDILKNINFIIDLIKQIGVWLIFIVLLMAIFILFNTIKLCVSSQSDEILLMKTIGATRSFICLPYIMQGVMLALTGALVAGFLVIVGYTTVYNNIYSVAAGFSKLLSPGTISAIIIPMFFILCFIVGVLSSVISVCKYLREKMG